MDLSVSLSTPLLASPSASSHASETASLQSEIDGAAFVKITHFDERHFDMTYVDGLNVDLVPFQTKKVCAAGGIYFCRKRDVLQWIESYERDGAHAWIRSVTLPADAHVFQESNIKHKASAVILGPRQSFVAWVSSRVTTAWFTSQLECHERDERDGPRGGSFKFPALSCLQLFTRQPSRATEAHSVRSLKS